MNEENNFDQDGFVRFGNLNDVINDSNSSELYGKYFIFSSGPIC